MENSFSRLGAARANATRQSWATLLGILTGVLSDHQLSDQEILFLKEWLSNNQTATSSWPGTVLAARIETALADGTITDAERADLIKTLQEIVGGKLEDLSSSKHVTALAMDEVVVIEFFGSTFCLTGDFVMGQKSVCEKAIVDRGGVTRAAVSKKTRYVIAGGLGSLEWKHGSFGTKIERAMQLKQEGVPILIVHEDAFSLALKTPN